MPDLETLRARTEAARQKYEEAARNEHEALVSRQSHLRGMSAVASAPSAPTAKRRGRPPGSKSKSASDNVVTMKPAKKRVTAEQKASRELQGRFIGKRRQLSKSKQKIASKIAKESGREAAIRWMESGAKSTTVKRTKTRKSVAIAAVPEVPEAETTTAAIQPEVTAPQTEEQSTPEAATA